MRKVWRHKNLENNKRFYLAFYLNIINLGCMCKIYNRVMLKATCDVLQTEIRKSLSSLARSSVEKEAVVEVVKEGNQKRSKVENVCERAHKNLVIDRERKRFEAASLNAVSLNKSSPSVFTDSSNGYELKTFSAPQE